MYNGEFEKQVQEKMEGLKMAPSANLWDRIEQDLPRKPRRRKMVVLLLLLLLGGCGLIWMLSQVLDKRADGLSSTVQSGNTADAVKHNNESAVFQPQVKNDSTGQADNVQENTAVQTHRGIDNKTSIPFVAADKQAEADKHKIAAAITSGVNTAPGNLSGQGIQPSATASNGIHDERANSNTLLKQRVSNKGRTKISVIQQPSVYDDPMNITAVDVLSPADAFSAELLYGPRASINKNLLPSKNLAVHSAEVIAASKNANRHDRKKWYYGFTLSGGLSKQVSNPLYFSSGNGQVAFLGIGGPPPSADSSGVGQQNAKPSAAFGAGFYILKPVNKRWSIQAGLSYEYLSYTSRVGRRIDSAAGYYVNGVQLYAGNYFQPVSFFSNAQVVSSQNYMNRLHLLRLPFEVQYSLGKKRQWSLLGGISAGYLLGSNALVYNSSPQLYLSSPEAFNKLLFSLHTGISYTSQKRYPVSAGLRLSYGANSFIKKTINDQHLVSSQLFLNIPLKR